MIFCIGVAVVSSVLTLLRYTADYLRADGVMQSIMSLQHVSLFFWGQNRLASVVPFLAQPVSGASANLVLCLFLNALAFHGALLIVAGKAASGLFRDHLWPGVAVTFGLMVAVTHAVLSPQTIYTFALDTQPYSLSWLLALVCVWIWPSRPIDSPRNCIAAIVLAGTAVGLNPSVVVGVAVLMLVRVVRRPTDLGGTAVFGVLWVGWIMIWRLLSSVFGGNAGPIPDAPQDYFTWSSASFAEGWPLAWQTMASAVNPLPVAASLLILGVCLAVIPQADRAFLLPRLGVAIIFCIVFVVVFTGNPWVAANVFGARYYFPVVLLLPIGIAVTLAAAVFHLARLMALRKSGSGARLSQRTAILLAAATAVASLVTLAGPLTRPSASIAFVQTRATYEFAESADIRFVAGDYWDVWPVVHQGLSQGRTAMFGLTFKSGGSREDYLAAFQAQLGSGTVPRALCLDQSADYCALFLDYWLQPGWSAEDTACPVTGSDPLLGEQQEKSCRVMRYTPGSPTPAAG